jgi:hypothetical protein
VARPRYHANRARSDPSCKPRANPSGYFARVANARISAVCPCFGRPVSTRRAWPSYGASSFLTRSITGRGVA